MSKPHKHKDLIIAWANGAEIEFRWATEPDMWRDCTGMVYWDEDAEYRIKPKKEYPKSSLTDDELYEIFSNAYGGEYGGYRAIADKSIKRYIMENEE